VRNTDNNCTWSIGAIDLHRVPYFDVALPPDGIDLVDVEASVDWAEPWLTGGQPTVGQAFWIIESEAGTIVVDPCGASDVFLRSGPEAVSHQVAAFDMFRAAGHDPDAIDHVVLTHLDGIGMAALADGADAGDESWTPAFSNADVILSDAEYDYIAGRNDVTGVDAFLQLDALGIVRPVATPYAVLPGVTLHLTGAHSPGHCRVEVASGNDRAVLVGHLAISPLHAAVGVSTNHEDPDGAWREFSRVLDDAARQDVLVAGSLWPAPGAVRVVDTDPYVVAPAPPVNSA
jgi:hypothetical protein